MRFRIGMAGTNPADFDPPGEPNAWAGAKTTEAPPEAELLGESFENASGLPLTGSQDFRVAQDQGDLMGRAVAKLAKDGKLPPPSPEDAEQMAKVVREAEEARIPSYWYAGRARQVIRVLHGAAFQVMASSEGGTDAPEPTIEDMDRIMAGLPMDSRTNEERARAFLGWDAAYRDVHRLAGLLREAEARGTMETLNEVSRAVEADEAEAREIIGRAAWRLARKADIRD